MKTTVQKIEEKRTEIVNYLDAHEMLVELLENAKNVKEVKKIEERIKACEKYLGIARKEYLALID